MLVRGVLLLFTTWSFHRSEHRIPSRLTPTIVLTMASSERSLPFVTKRQWFSSNSEQTTRVCCAKFSLTLTFRDSGMSSICWTWSLRVLVTSLGVRQSFSRRIIDKKTRRLSYPDPMEQCLRRTCYLIGGGVIVPVTTTLILGS